MILNFTSQHVTLSEFNSQGQSLRKLLNEFWILSTKRFQGLKCFALLFQGSRREGASLRPGLSRQCVNSLSNFLP